MWTSSSSSSTSLRETPAKKSSRPLIAPPRSLWVPPTSPSVTLQHWCPGALAGFWPEDLYTQRHGSTDWATESHWHNRFYHFHVHLNHVKNKAQIWTGDPRHKRHHALPTARRRNCNSTCLSDFCFELRAQSHVLKNSDVHCFFPQFWVTGEGARPTHSNTSKPLAGVMSFWKVLPRSRWSFRLISGVFLDNSTVYNIAVC